MKKRFYSVYFYISFIPLAIILLYSVYHATVGIRYTFLFTSHIIYGVEGFLYALFISGFVLFPAFFACLIYFSAKGYNIRFPGHRRRYGAS